MLHRSNVTGARLGALTGIVRESRDVPGDGQGVAYGMREFSPGG